MDSILFFVNNNFSDVGLDDTFLFVQTLIFYLRGEAYFFLSEHGWIDVVKDVFDNHNEITSFLSCIKLVKWSITVLALTWSDAFGEYP
ncbi:hypothetical protein JOD02_002075 [Caldicoprobacter guelmensis]|nr:hypothetical protein [Caldicoprobacter guelmensis]